MGCLLGALGFLFSALLGLQPGPVAAEQFGAVGAEPSEPSRFDGKIEAQPSTLPTELGVGLERHILASLQAKAAEARSYGIEDEVGRPSWSAPLRL